MKPRTNRRVALVISLIVGEKSFGVAEECTGGCYIPVAKKSG
jgi:hypothetical protein